MSDLDLNAPSAGELIDSAPAVKDGSKGARNIKRVKRGQYGGDESLGPRRNRRNGQANDRDAGNLETPIEQPPKTRYTMRLAYLNIDRETWRTHWLDIKQLFLPYRTRWLDDGGLPNRGNKKMQHIVDNKPMVALRTMSAGLMAGMTSPSRPWFRIKADKEELNAAPGVAEWCERVTDGIHKILQKSNFYRAMPTFYEEIGAFGTAAIGIYEIPEDASKPHQPLLYCITYTCGEYWIASDDYGNVNTFIRKFKWTVRQVVMRFVDDPSDPDDPTWDNILPSTKGLWRARKWDTWVDVVHVIEPNDSWEAGQLGTKGMKTRSLYYEMGGDPNTILGVRGYMDQVVHVARWDVNSDNVYGHSPAMYCLGDAKQLMIQQKRKMQAIDKQMEPPLIGDASLKRQTVSLLPGDVNWLELSASTSFGLKPIYEVKPDINAMLADQEETKKRIATAMYEDVFQMMKALDDQLKAGITATEINARKQEQLLELGPLLDRLNGEAFGPIIDQVFDIAVRRSRLAWQYAARGLPIPDGVEEYIPPPPKALAGKRLEVEYVSILAQAVRVAEIQGIQQTTQYALMLAEAKPDVLDKLDFDKAIAIIADRTGTPPEMVVADAIVKNLRDQRAQQQQQAMQAQMQNEKLQSATQAAKNLGQTPVGGSNALDQLLNGPQGAPGQ